MKYVHKTVEQFEAGIMQMMALTSGIDPHTLGPNIRGIIRLQAESMYAQQTAFEEMLADMQIATGVGRDYDAEYDALMADRKKRGVT